MAVVGIQENRAHLERKRAAGKCEVNALGHCMRRALSLARGVWRNRQDFDPNWGLKLDETLLDLDLPANTCDQTSNTRRYRRPV